MRDSEEGCPATVDKATFLEDTHIQLLLQEPGNNTLAKELFPARTKEDLEIHVCRIGDVLEYTARHNRTEEILQLAQGSGLFDDDAKHFYVAARTLSDTVKKRETELADYDRVSLYECACLYGAMCPPVPGWDPVAETHDLAKYTGYEVLNGEEWRRGHLKARKNLVLDVIEPADLLDAVRTHHTQDNKALVKSEFGKIRLAVSAPLPTYLQQAYLSSIAGCPYLNWPGNTLEESLEEEMLCNEKTIMLMRRGFSALPYDFAHFDNQPTTPEVVEFQKLAFTCALMNANP
ncbi:hypothetical protein HPB50_003398 [Hyalomma asiaticum]|uniref:Uncharacterized protein n=1 Tax=Hyalomma asiaticum TaxID=266040 RepID=A0ACB7RQT9_HYAAI|nr:hypothetical protein HPB50_003398 [Hyalomma asiaticum]